MSHSSLPVPDACSLERPAFEERLARMRTLMGRSRRRRRIPGGAAWDFDATPELRDALARLVEQERACCDPERIAFSLHEDPASATLRLEVLGIDPDAPLLGGGAPVPRASGWTRLAGAGGIGAAGALALLCGVPMLVAAVAGAAVAAPFAVLETPAALATGTLVLGALAWWILRRRADHPC